MNKVIFLLVSVCFIGSLGIEDQHCNVSSNPIETFDISDEPDPVVIGQRTWYTPWGYHKTKNADRKYPLVVFGAHNEASDFFTTKIRKRYPAFYVTYKEKTESAGAALSDLIDTCMNNHAFRIDTNRIYLTGWSAGGSGSFKLVRGFLSKGKYFAAINRVAGQSERVLAEKAVNKTAIWMHIGLLDSAIRVQVSRDVYSNLKNNPNNTPAIETTIKDTVKHNGVDVIRHTNVLTMNGVETVRYTEYPTEPHAAFAGYSDPYLYEWLFGRTICVE
jgi:predicted peptidase